MESIAEFRLSEEQQDLRQRRAAEGSKHAPDKDVLVALLLQKGLEDLTANVDASPLWKE